MNKQLDLTKRTACVMADVCISVSQPVSQSTSQPASQPASQSVSHLVSQPAIQPVSQLASHSVSQQVSQSASQSVSKVVSQSVTQSVSQPASQSVSQSVRPSHSVPPKRRITETKYFSKEGYWCCKLNKFKNSCQSGVNLIKVGTGNVLADSIMFWERGEFFHSAIKVKGLGDYRITGPYTKGSLRPKITNFGI